MSRQLIESIKIANKDSRCTLLNKKDEYNRCKIPGILIEGFKDTKQNISDDKSKSEQKRKLLDMKSHKSQKVENRKS